MAFALPIVCTACETGVRELLENKRDAIMVPVDNHHALADALLGLTSNHAGADQLAPAGAKRLGFFHRIAEE